MKGLPGVRQDGLNSDAERAEVAYGVMQELLGTDLGFVRIHRREGNARVVVDGDEEVFPASAVHRMARIACRPVPDANDASNFLDIDMQQRAGGRVLIVLHRQRGSELPQPRQASTAQDAI